MEKHCNLIISTYCRSQNIINLTWLQEKSLITVPSCLVLLIHAGLTVWPVESYQLLLRKSFNSNTLAQRQRKSGLKVQDTASNWRKPSWEPSCARTSHGMEAHGELPQSLLRVSVWHCPGSIWFLALFIREEDQTEVYLSCRPIPVLLSLFCC